MPIFEAILVTIATVKFKQMPEFYTSAILLIYESKEICEKQISVFCPKGGHFSPLMHIPLSAYFFECMHTLAKMQDDSTLM